MRQGPALGSGNRIGVEQSRQTHGLLAVLNIVVVEPCCRLDSFHKHILLSEQHALCFGRRIILKSVTRGRKAVPLPQT